jgi:hypothetical protein
MGMGQLRPQLHQKQSSGRYVVLLRFAEVLVPIRELVSVFDVPSHPKYHIPLMECFQGRGKMCRATALPTCIQFAQISAFPRACAARQPTLWEAGLLGMRS